MNLGDKILQWLSDLWARMKSNPPVSSFLAAWDDFNGIFEGKPPDAVRAAIDAAGAIPLPQTQTLAAILSALTGKPLAGNQVNILTELSKMLENPEGYLARKATEVTTSGEAIAASAILSDVISGAVLSKLTQAAGQAERDPIVLAGEVLSAITVAKVALGSVGVSAEILGLGQIKTVQEALGDIAHSLNVEQIVGRAIDPLFASAITPAAERFYNQKFRNARLGARDLAVLLRFGVVGEGDFTKEAAQEGWRDEDIERIKELARTRVDPSDVIEARTLGQVGDGEVIQKLREFRYSDEDAAFIVELAERRRHQEWSERLFSLALRQFTNYRIDASKLADIGRAAGFSQERIQIEVAVAKATTEAQVQDLSIGEIEAAYKANKLGRQEAVAYLNKIHVDPSGIPILLETWDASRKAGGTHLNAQKLTEAFHAGLLDESQLHNKLLELGWNPTDARLIVKIAEWQKPSKVRDLSEGIVATAFTDGVLTREQALAHLKKLDFSDEDAQTILKIHTILPKQREKELTDAQLAKAFELGALSEGEVLNRLVRLGYTEDDAALLFVILTNKVPSAKKSKPPAPKE